jgi:hypothetical protein
VTAADAPGFKFGSAHGAAFVPDHSPDPAAAALAQLSAGAAQAFENITSALDIHIGPTGAHPDPHAGLHVV